MGDKSVEVLSESLKDSTSLKVLNLSKNEISDKGCTSVCKVID